MLKVYVDTGGYLPEFKELERAGLIELCGFPFENTTKRVRTIVAGSGATYDQAHGLSYSTVVGSFDDFKPSELLGRIRAIVQKPVDAQHLDSAYKASCTVFVTTDKDDIWSKREQLASLLGITVMYMPGELEALRQLAHGQRNPEQPK
jgi:hypothetical protein